MTIPQSEGAHPTATAIRAVVETYERSTTGPDAGRLQNTKRMARWSRRLATYLLRVADEQDRMQRMLEAQGEMLRKHHLDRCCLTCGFHSTPHRGCILR